MRSAIRAAAWMTAVVPLFIAAPAASQSAAGVSAAGVWETEMPTRVENRNGVEQASDPIRITITLEQRGDSVLGTWQRAPREGLPEPKPMKLKGMVKDGQLTLQSEPTMAKVQMGGSEPTDVEMFTTYVLKVAADELTGTQSSASTDGSIQSQQRAFTAKRVK